MRQMAPVRKHAQGPPLLPHRSKTQTEGEAKEQQTRVFAVFLFLFIVIWFLFVFIFFLFAVFLRLFVVILHLFVVILSLFVAV